MTRHDDAFLRSLERFEISDPPKAEEFERMYQAITDELVEAVSDFGVAELEEMMQTARAIRARRPVVS